MHASVRRFRCDPAQMDELMHRVDEEFVGQIEDQPGFCDYQAVDCGDGLLVTITMFSDREGAERSVDTAADFVRDRLSDYEIERLDVSNGEVMVSRAASEMLEPAHH
jgi:hypothetical protein